MISRAATAADVPAVLALERRCFGVDAWGAASLLEELTGADRRAVLVCDPEVVGYAVATVPGHPADPVDLQRIAVHPDRRRQGLAGALLDAVAPSGRVLLEVAEGNAAARALYVARGFTPIARRDGYYRDGSAAVVMERPARPERWPERWPERPEPPGPR